MKKKPVISIIIPVFNAAAWLKRCLDSVTGQTFRELDIVLVDDGSSDDSPGICASYTASDDRVRLIRQANAGPSAARNAGIAAAAGEYLMFVDADDYIEPNMAESLLAGIKEQNCQWAVCACRQVDAPEKGGASRVIPLGRAGVYPSRESLMGFARHDIKIMTSFASLWNKIFQADILREHGIRFRATCPGTAIPVYPQEDFFFNLEYLRHAANICFIDRPLYYYQTHAGNLNAVRKYRPHAFELHREVYGAVKKIIWDACTLEERRNFHRHHVDKTLIIMAILCRDNPVLDRPALIAKMRTILAAPEVVESLAGCTPKGSQSNILVWLMRRRAARVLYLLSRKRGNIMYGRG